MTCWYIENCPENMRLIYRSFRNVARIDGSSIFPEKSPENLKKASDLATSDYFSSLNLPSVPKRRKMPLQDLKRTEREAEFLKKLEVRRYSKSTKKTYLSQFRKFERYFQDKDIEHLTKEEIRDYLLHLIKKDDISQSTQNQVINAIKFYYEQVLGQEKETYWIERPRKEKKLPNVISEESVQRMLSSIDNLKHLCVVGLLYSSGLRRGEVINIRKGDIDIERRQIRVRGAKGKKDRVTILSKHMTRLLVQYVAEYKPQYWLFEGAIRGKYSAGSVGNVVKRAARKAGIAQRVTPHTLRHSFATHLLEQGTDTRFIQELLGHYSLETTSIYTHVATKNFEKIESPLDRIFKDGSLVDNKLLYSILHIPKHHQKF
jgi:integrase/recombinase XerD